MNNILKPKGKIDQYSFVINQIILYAFFIFCGVTLFIPALKHLPTLIIAVMIIFFIKILISFNYKKRLLDITNNLPISVILSIILAFAGEIFIPLIPKGNNLENAISIFFITITVLFIIPPLILAFIPSKK